MGNGPVIVLNQVLHGYRNGHQLIEASCELSQEAKRVLLFQSDLSGDFNTHSFDNYVTGYPIIESGLYAVAKTWYAYEMKRPGCVWTHTILIDFADVGKFIDLSILSSLFVRPFSSRDESNKYNKYINLDLNFNFNSVSLDEEDIIKKKKILDNLYLDFERPAIIPIEKPTDWEKTIFSVWSDQWPRLRRNFKFCTGALDKKSLNKILFDLQLVPLNYKNISSNNDISSSRTKVLWKYVLSEEVDNKLRRFLWLVGSDIEGTRENYYKLINIYNVLFSESASIDLVIFILVRFFPERNEAKTLKRICLSKESIFKDRLSELEIIKAILKSDYHDFYDFDYLEIQDRILHLINSEELNFKQFIDLWKEVPKGRIDKNFWSLLRIDINNDLYSLINEDEEILDILLDISPNFVEMDWVWNSPKDFQYSVLKKISTFENVNWDTILLNLLSSNSEAILGYYEIRGKRTISYALDWLNSQTADGAYITREFEAIIKSNYSYVNKWLYSRRKILGIKIYTLIYSLFGYEGLSAFNLPLDFWTRFARVSFESSNLPLSVISLSVGLRRKNEGGEWIVKEVFQYVFSYARYNYISYNLWQLVPIEEYSEDERGFLSNFMYMLGFKQRTAYVQSWDYCEILIRNLVHFYIKYPLDKQVFVETLTQEHIFFRAVEYCISLRKGQKFLFNLTKQIEIKSSIILPFQRDILEFIKKKFDE